MKRTPHLDGQAAHAVLRRSSDGWISTPTIPVDYRGPVDHSFIAIPDALVDRPILEALQEVVLRNPLAIAVHTNHRTLRYGEMWDAIARLAAAIEAHPSQPSVIAVLLPFSAEWWVAMFACIAVGRIAVPLDPKQPPGRLADLISVTGTGLVLVADGSTAIPSIGPSLSVTPCLDDRGLAPLLPPVRVGIDDPAFIICTSGSTGRPKAIVCSQRSAMHNAQTNINAAHLSSADRMLSVMSPATWGGFVNLLRISLAGASFCPVNLNQGGFLAVFAMLEAEPITILTAGASLLRVIASLPQPERAFAKLRIVMSGGEPLMKADMEALCRHLPRDCLIRTNYSSTEAGSIGWFANGPDTYHPVRVATGILAPHVEAMVVDDDGQPCPPGVAGELLMRSQYFSLGEWVEGQLVPGRIQRDPVHPDLRIYATGDLAQYYEDGVFVVLGRKDRQVKVNGQRVEPGEIEAVLRAAAGVAQAVVIARQSGPAAMIHAFVVPATPVAPDLEKQLRQILRARLPSYMIPARIHVIEELPLLPGGKLDAAALLARI